MSFCCKAVIRNPGFVIRKREMVCVRSPSQVLITGGAR